MTFRGYIFDLDGTLYLGDRLLPGAATTIRALRAQGRRVVFVSNKPLQTPEMYATKLTTLGIPAEPSDIMNSGRLTVDCLRREHPAARIFLIGEQVMANELQAAGFRAATDPKQTDIVLISLDRQVDYRKLHFAYHAVRHGAVIWATNPDVICPVADDEWVDAGATIAAVEALIRRPIDRVVGKPSPVMCETVGRMMNLPPYACLVVGDRLDTDIAMGQRAGMSTALALTGVTDRAMLQASALQPTYVLERIEDLLEI